MTISDAIHRLLLDNLTTATILLDAELRLEYMNPAAEMLLAVSGQRSHGQFISELFTESPEALNSLRQAVEQAHPFTKREAMLTALTGQTLTVDYAVTPILSNGETLLLLEVHPRDRLLRITKEEAQLSKQETSKMLVRGLAHEIKNPLGGIRGAAQLLARELPEESLRDYTNVIIEEADRLRNLVDRMLGSNKLPSLAMCNVHEVLERVCHLVEAESQGCITLVRDYDPSIPDVLIDREQMIQAVLNIVRQRDAGDQQPERAAPGPHQPAHPRHAPIHHRPHPPSSGDQDRDHRQRPGHSGGTAGNHFLSDGQRPPGRYRAGPGHYPEHHQSAPGPDRV